MACCSDWLFQICKGTSLINPMQKKIGFCMVSLIQRKQKSNFVETLKSYLNLLCKGENWKFLHPSTQCAPFLPYVCPKLSSLKIPCNLTLLFPSVSGLFTFLFHQYSSQHQILLGSNTKHPQAGNSGKRFVKTWKWTFLVFVTYY